MSSRLIVPDTNILILASQGRFDLLTLFESFDDVLISVVTQVEALGFNFAVPLEEQTMARYFQDLTVLSFTELEARYAIAYRRLKKIKFPDAAILATARAAGADLLTQNTADFRALDPAVRLLTIQDL